MPQAEFHPLGALFALVFATAIGSILWWMLHPPKPREVVERLAETVEEVERAVGQILVGFKGTAFSEQLLKLACELAKEEKAPLSALYVIELPMTLPLHADVPKEVDKANQALARAREIVAPFGLQVNTEIRRARRAGRALVDAATSRPTSTIVMGVAEKVNLEDRLFGSSAEFVLRHAPCEVLVRRPARAEMI